MNALQYQNPVWPGYFADPFVLRIGHSYYAYGTGPADANGREFPVLHSTDLIHWEFFGGALEPLLHPRACNYWAPEVAAKGGQFFMYYSASTTNSDADQRLRVATAENPAGPFHDSSRLLMPSMGFSIDAHPFIDPADGRAYLFFASDFERDDPTGTGLSVIPLNDNMLETVGEPRTVLRASAPWQIYEANRNYKDRIWPEWHCVEGPFVVQHDGKYYCFYSGGDWRSENYGVGWAVADHPQGPWREPAAASGPSVLKAIPGTVPGPGHASVVVAPDNVTDIMVYHAWDPARTQRRMCIDPIEWTSQGPRAKGPTVGIQTLLPAS